MSERLCLNWNDDGTMFCNGPRDHDGGCVLVTPETIIRSLEAERDRLRKENATLRRVNRELIRNADGLLARIFNEQSEDA